MEGNFPAAPCVDSISMAPLRLQACLWAALLLAGASGTVRAQEPSAPAAGAEESWDARFTKVEGDVSVRTAGTDDWRDAAEGVPLDAGDEVEVGDDGSAEITLEGDNVIQLSSGTDFTVASLSKKTAAVQLTAGSLIAKLASFLGRHELEVQTQTAVAAVRGTEFGVGVAEGQTTVGVFDEGKVGVRPAGAAASQEVTLEPGREAAVQAGRPIQSVPLRFFAERRAHMRLLRARMATIRRLWRRLAVQKRRTMRQRFLKRKAMRRAQMLQRRQAFMQRRQARMQKRMHRLERQNRNLRRQKAQRQLNKKKRKKR